MPGGRPESIASSSSFRQPHRHRRRYGRVDRPAAGRAARRNAAPMHPDATDDLPLLAERLRLGLPLRGFDGREIPLRTARASISARPRRPTRCSCRARACSRPSTPMPSSVPHSPGPATSRPPPAWRAIRPTVIAAKVTAVLVSAAVRASVIARGPDVSPSAINRATLSWYEISHLRRRELLDGRVRRAGGSAPVRLGERTPPSAARRAFQTVPPPVPVRPRIRL